MPFAGPGVVWIGEAVRDRARFTIGRHRRPRLLYEGLVAAVVIAGVFIGWPRMLAAGARLRSEHRWAVAACSVGGAGQVCGFKPEVARGQPSPVRGTWDGFGLKLAPPGTTAAVTTDLDLPAGNYRVSMRMDCGDRCPDDAEVAVSAAGAELRRTPWPAAGSVVALVVPITHAGGKLHLEIRIDGKNLHPEGGVPALWISAFEVEPEKH